jgi:parallel beta-helix repeat protein
MSNYTRSTLTGDLAPVNAELEKVQQSIADKLDRSPSAGQANQLNTQLDANNNNILNVPTPLLPTDLVRLKDLVPTQNNSILPPQETQTGKYLTTDGATASWASVTKTTVGLNNVDNTSDISKQTATLAAATKVDVGLSNVDNTSDVNKPVSTAQQTALSLKGAVEGSTVFLISSTDTYTADTVVITNGFTTSGDGGEGRWKQNGVTGQTASQSPAQLGSALLNDGIGNQWSLVGESIQVMQLGAIPNASDSSAAIQAAQNTLKPTIFKGSQTYFISTGITVKSSIIANGAVIKRTAGTSFTNLLFLSGKSNIKIVGLGIDGNEANATGGFTNIQIENSCFNIKILNCEVLNAKGHGVSITNSDTCLVENCKVSNSVNLGVEIRSSTNCIVTKNRINFCDVGIDLTKDVNNNTNIIISKNIVASSVRAGISVPRDVASSALYSTDIVLTGNIVATSGENGFLIQPNRASVIGNISRNNGTLTSHQGFVINGSDIAISGNVSEFNSGVGIDLGDAQNCTVTGNTIRGNGIIGLEINSSINVVATGNLITNNYTSNPSFSYQAGAVINGNSTQFPNIESSRIKFSNNIITAGTHQTHGLYINESNSVSVDNNDFVSSGTTSDIGVNVDSQNDYTLSKNKVNNPSIAASTSTLTFKAGAEFITIATTAGTTIDTILVAEINTIFEYQRLDIYCAVAQTFSHFVGNITINGGSNYTAPANTLVSFVFANGFWRMEKI